MLTTYEDGEGYFPNMMNMDVYITTYDFRHFMFVMMLCGSFPFVVFGKNLLVSSSSTSDNSSKVELYQEFL